MDLSSIIGNEEIKASLNHMVAHERVGHSLLFAGPDGIGKSLFATALATEMLGGDASQRQKVQQGTHPDLHVYRPEGKVAMHSIDSLRGLSDEVHLPPNEAKYKIFIIHDADRMLPTSANALLKTFEEPAPQTLILLLSSIPQALLPTVLSRCRRLYFKPISEQLIASFLQERHSCEVEVAKRVAAQANGSIGRAVGLLNQQGDSQRELVLNTLARGRLSGYKELSQIVDVLHEYFEKLKEDLTTFCTQEIAPVGFEELSAVQREAIQKEIDGAITLRVREQVDALLEAVLGWYRDIELICCGGDMRLLTHRDRADVLQHAYESGRLRPLPDVQAAVAEARLNIARSSSIRTTLESLFLKLDLL